MSLVLAGVSQRNCPKCDSYNFWCERTTIGESYEMCTDCGYSEKGKERRRFRKVGCKPFDHRNYVTDPKGDYHQHGRRYPSPWHKISVKHRRVKGQLYRYAELEEVS